MKKIILLSLIAIVLSNCEISPRKVQANQIKYGLNFIYHHEGTMKYLIVMTRGNAYGGNSYCITVANLTKDSLECEHYRQQLKK